MLVPILALSILQGVSAAPSAADRMAAASDAATLVVLDCQLANRALKDCKVVSDSGQPQSDAALKQALALTIPDAVAASGASHVRIKLHIDP